MADKKKCSILSFMPRLLMLHCNICEETLKTLSKEQEEIEELKDQGKDSNLKKIKEYTYGRE